MPRFAFSVAMLAVCAASVGAQSGRYWPQHEIAFPVPTSVLENSPKPVKLRLYVDSGSGRFERVSELAVNKLQPIDGRKPGFIYTARGDGTEEFALQMVFADDTASPSVENLRGDRVTFDTKPPSVNLTTLGVNGVQWTATDENLDSASIKLEVRWTGETRWHPVTTKNFAAKDEYNWPSITRTSQTLEVRVLAKDKAGHEGVSRVVKLPSGGTPAAAGNDPIRNPDDIPNATTQIVYVNKRDMTIRSKLTHITRSGVSKVHLYVKDLSASGSEWKFDKSQNCEIKYEASDTTVEIPYVAAKDGRYGFIVIPESGVGRREPEPRISTPPQHLVEVDTIKPVIKIRTVNVTPGGTIGPRVEIEWDADDRNLMPDPIVLEYAADKSALTWTTIAEKIPNSRRYVWEASDKTLFKLYIRARATDKATNVGEHVYDQAVIIDLDKPSATIDGIRGSNSPFPSSDRGTPPPLGTPVPLPSVTPGISPELLPSPGKDR